MPLPLFGLVLVCLAGAGNGLRCHLDPTVNGENATECDNGYCFTGIHGRGCLDNCSTNDTITVCCDFDYCNNGTDATPSGVPIQCYSCSTDSKDRCDEQQTLVPCEVGKLCRTVVHTLSSIFGGGVSSVQKNCFSRETCKELDECNTDMGGNCIRCCDCDRCNEGDIDTRPRCPEPSTQPNTPTPRVTPSITSTSAKTTVAPNVTSASTITSTITSTNTSTNITSGAASILSPLSEILFVVAVTCTVM